MKNIYSILAVIVLLSLPDGAFAQLKIKRASLSTSVKNAPDIQIGNYNVQQSIGHMGVMGTVNHSENAVLRGFLLPHDAVSTVVPPADFDLYVYPNPFVDYVDLSFSKTVSGNMLLRLHDVTGRLVFEQTSQVKQKQRIDLGFLAQAEYILSVEVMGELFSQNLLNYKTPNKE